MLIDCHYIAEGALFSEEKFPRPIPKCQETDIYECGLFKLDIGLLTSLEDGQIVKFMNGSDIKLKVRLSHLT